MNSYKHVLFALRPSEWSLKFCAISTILFLFFGFVCSIRVYENSHVTQSDLARWIGKENASKQTAHSLDWLFGKCAPDSGAK